MLIKNRYIFITLILSSTVAVAADLNNPSAGPADTLSYTLQDICNRLRSGKEGTQQNFTEPTSGPANDSTDCTLNDVMKTAPKKETANGAQPNDVTKDKKYWGLTDGNNWGIKTGSSTAVDTSSGNATANDIKEGKRAWVDGKEVVGTFTAINTSSGNATANEIKKGKIAWVDGKKVVGTVKLLIICNGTMHGKRWCDNGDGTVTDMTTGLVWLQRASWGGKYAFACSDGAGECTTIFDRVSELKNSDSDANLSDGSTHRDWRIPTYGELYNLAHSVLSGEMRAFSAVPADFYWSSSVYKNWAWVVSLSDGDHKLYDKPDHYYVWPVRNYRP